MRSTRTRNNAGSILMIARTNPGVTGIMAQILYADELGDGLAVIERRLDPTSGFARHSRGDTLGRKRFVPPQARQRSPKKPRITKTTTTTPISQKILFIVVSLLRCCCRTDRSYGPWMRRRGQGLRSGTLPQALGSPDPPTAGTSSVGPDALERPPGIRRVAARDHMNGWLGRSNGVRKKRRKTSR